MKSGSSMYVLLKISLGQKILREERKWKNQTPLFEGNFSEECNVKICYTQWDLILNGIFHGPKKLN